MEVLQERMVTWCIGVCLMSDSKNRKYQGTRSTVYMAKSHMLMCLHTYDVYSTKLYIEINVVM